MENARTTSAASSTSAAVYARILARIHSDELQEHCRSVQQRDAKRTHRQFVQLNDTLRRLRAVDAATRVLVPDAAASGASVLLARLLELRELHTRLGCAVESLTPLARSTVLRTVREEHS